MYACYVYNAIITYIKSVGVLISKMFLSTVKKIMQRIFFIILHLHNYELSDSRMFSYERRIS